LKRKIAVFGEDTAHESFLTALLNRLAHEYGIAIEIKVFSATGGITKVHYEFKKFLKDLDAGKIDHPDLVVLATDSNCNGYLKRKQELEGVSGTFPSLKDDVSYAIPDPHIERWLLSDPAAFKSVFGKGCESLPVVKCKKDDYKQMLMREVQKAAGTKPPLGGIEYTQEIVENLNLAFVEKQEPSFEKLFKDLKSRFNSWVDAKSIEE
jgi:hypothetical protein